MVLKDVVMVLWMPESRETPVNGKISTLISLMMLSLMMEQEVIVLFYTTNVITKVNLLKFVLKNVTSEVSTPNPSMYPKEKPPHYSVELVVKEKPLNSLDLLTVLTKSLSTISSLTTNLL